MPVLIEELSEPFVLLESEAFETAELTFVVVACTLSVCTVVVFSVDNGFVSVGCSVLGFVVSIGTTITELSFTTVNVSSRLSPEANDTVFILVLSPLFSIKPSGIIASKDTFSTAKSLVLVTLNVRSISSFD